MELTTISLKYRFKSKDKKHWASTIKHHIIGTFIEATQNDINEHLWNTKESSYSTLTIKELRVLEHWKDVIIKSAEKGGSIVIQDVKQYIKEAERQLNNTKNYRSLPNAQQK